MLDYEAPELNDYSSSEKHLNFLKASLQTGLVFFSYLKKKNRYSCLIAGNVFQMELLYGNKVNLISSEVSASDYQSQ